jgi:uncharacterized membrane protein
VSAAVAARRPASALRAAGREQALLAGGQLLAGAGNLGFALLCAHILEPRAYSRLAAFLAAYLLLYMPFSALAAGGALAPQDVARRRARALLAGAAFGVPLAAAAAAGLGPRLGLDAALLLALALAAPVAGPLALERGRALGEGRRKAAIASLLAEPAVRLGFGVPAAIGLGAPGAATAVILGGYAALYAAARGGRRFAPASRPAAPGRMVTAAFLLLAVLQNQDILWANAQLGGVEAAHFAVLSTLGGMAAFATTTVPLVLLPRARRGQPGALGAAVGAAALLGAAAIVPAALDTHLLVSAVFGGRYAAVAPLVVPYLAAMALLGVSRVLVAYRCAVAPGRPVLALLGACAAAQALFIALLGHDAAAVAHATLAACAALAAGLLVSALRPGRPRPAPEATVPAPVSPPVRRRRAPSTVALLGAAPALEPAAAPAPVPPPARPRRRRSLALAIGALTVAGLAVRLLAGRSLWLDEATSITQAQMPFGAMLHSLRTTDVQPPLHDVVLWLLYRALGKGEEVMRAPSLLAGVALIPVVYAIGRDLWDRRTGLVAAALLVVAPFAVWYSQEARMYALFMLFASLALWGQVRVLCGEDEARWGSWALYALATAALLWTQYFGLLFAGVQQAAFVVAIVARRGRRRPLVLGWLASLVVIGACVTPLLPFAWHQYQANQASGRGFGVTPTQNGTDLEAGHRTPTVYAVLTNLVWGVWGYHSNRTMQALTAMWPLGILLALALLGRGRSWRVTLLLALVAVPVAALFAVGQVKPFLFEIRYFCAGVPVAVLLLARLCTRWPGRSRAGTAAFAAILAASFAVASADQQLSQTNPRLYDFQGAIARISRQMRPGDALLYAPQYLNDLVAYYAPRARSAPLTADSAGVAPHGQVFVMASFQEQPQNARFVRGALTALRRARRQFESFTRPQVQVWAFR